MATLWHARSTHWRPVVSNTRTICSATLPTKSFLSCTRPQTLVRLSLRTQSASNAARRPRTLFIRTNTHPSRQVARYASSTTTSSASAVTSEEILTWDRFFNLRRRRRFINLGASLVCAFGAVTVSAPLIADSDIDKTFSQTFGIQLDPMIVLGMTTFAVAAVGWMCGPSFGTAGFRMWAARKGWDKAITQKEKSFFARIKRYRADPSKSSPQNPIPDYYGEKIASVKDYRRWLKDQRTFARKATKNMI